MKYFKEANTDVLLIVNEEALTVTRILKNTLGLSIIQNVVTTDDLPIVLEQFTNSLISLEDESEVAPVLLQIKDRVAAI